jgi:hypothetical protein
VAIPLNHERDTSMGGKEGLIGQLPFPDKPHSTFSFASTPVGFRKGIQSERRVGDWTYEAT